MSLQNYWVYMLRRGWLCGKTVQYIFYFSPPMINSASVSVVVSVTYEPSETWTGSPQCFWISSRRVQWCPVRRGLPRAVAAPPPLSKLAWRGCASMRRPEGSSRTHIARWAPVFHFEVLPFLFVYIWVSALRFNCTPVYFLPTGYLLVRLHW